MTVLKMSLWIIIDDSMSINLGLWSDAPNCASQSSLMIIIYCLYMFIVLATGVISMKTFFLATESTGEAREY